MSQLLVFHVRVPFFKLSHYDNATEYFVALLLSYAMIC